MLTIGKRQEPTIFSLKDVLTGDKSEGPVDFVDMPTNLLTGSLGLNHIDALDIIIKMPPQNFIKIAGTKQQRENRNDNETKKEFSIKRNFYHHRKTSSACKRISSLISRPSSRISFNDMISFT